MDAPSLSPERSIELAALRRRAYGPDADIARDPAAQRRLSELEDLARTPFEQPAEPLPLDQAPPLDRAPFGEAGADETGVVAASARRSRAPAAREVTEHPEPPGEAEVEPPSAPAAPDRPWWRRIPLWSVAAVAGVALGAGIGFTWPDGGGPRPDLTLRVDPRGGERGAGFTENLDYWGVDAGTVVPHEGYDKIQVWTALGIDDSRCLLLSHEGSFLSATCTGSGLDPVLDFTIYDGMSLELDTPLPVGTIIRFAGREGAVDVWVRPPGGQAPEASSSSVHRPRSA